MEYAVELNRLIQLEMSGSRAKRQLKFDAEVSAEGAETQLGRTKASYALSVC